ncbi:Glutathione S-transferase [Hoeflea phototrophica DFL-43]|jgi:glutathione S-transferase|uniref:Glutathione S-transferase n=1 Tax=Hoeflea phototrophica (strain DSM 17068 / NCIMB 14078 / DFL-43) TaxID=411684 RepID=A9D486_HOEPD|nr:glutathione S-transferase family protein [Hoeflea phototrophica]EDQ33834.1 Glutathione S-transferase [Hoeflea phototrophica DFL-43]
MTITLYELAGTDLSRPFSPHCWKTAMALAHKGLDFDRKTVSVTQVPQVEGGVSKTVPVIRDGSRVVADSFLIADYLEETYPDRPSLFGGEGGQAMARFVESWSQSTLHAALNVIALQEIHDRLAPEDQAYFIPSREARLGKSFDEVAALRDAEIAGFSAKLTPLRVMLKSQPWIGGSSPLFADYIVFGALQWVRLVSTARLLEEGDAVTDWFERCLDLHGGLGRSAPAAG